METNTESSKETKNTLIENIIGITEKISALFLIIPFVSVVFGGFQGNDYFFFFPLGLLLFFPVGVFALAIQLFRKSKFNRKPITLFNRIMIGCSTVTVIIGILGCMLVYVAVG